MAGDCATAARVKSTILADFATGDIDSTCRDRRKPSHLATPRAAVTGTTPEMGWLHHPRHPTRPHTIPDFWLPAGPISSMLRGMTLRLIPPCLCSAAALLLFACSPSTDLPLMAGNNQQAAGEGEVLFQQATQADTSGNTKRAIKLYDKVATRYPFATSAPQARFRQAELLEHNGQIVDAFDA